MNIKYALMDEMSADGSAAGGAAPSVDSGAGASATSDGLDDDGDLSLDFLMLDSGDEGGVGEVTPAVPSVAVQPAQTPAPAPAVAPATAPTAVAPAVAPAPAPAVNVPTVAPTSDPAPAPAAQMTQEEARGQALTGLTGRWQQDLTPEVVERLFEAPQEVLPVLFAQAELRAMETAMTQVMNMIPRMIDGYVASQQATSTLESTFFGEYPQLKEHENAVAAAVTLLGKTPGFDFNSPQVRARVAGMVMAELGLLGQPMPAQAAPAQGMRPTPAPSLASRGPVAVQTQEQNPWLALLGDD